MKKDAFGEDLNIGDVIYFVTGTYVEIGMIFKITKVMLYSRTFAMSSSYNRPLSNRVVNSYITKIHPARVVKLSESQRRVYISDTEFENFKKRYLTDE